MSEKSNDTLTVATLNINGWAGGRAVNCSDEQIIQMMDKHQIDILTIQELKQDQRGLQDMAYRLKSRNLICIGEANEVRSQGVAIVYRKYLQPLAQTVRFEGVSERLVGLKLCKDEADITILCAYLPTGPSSEEKHEQGTPIINAILDFQQEQDEGHSIILSGDLNVELTSSAAGTLQKNGDPTAVRRKRKPVTTGRGKRVPIRNQVNMLPMVDILTLNRDRPDSEPTHKQKVSTGTIKNTLDYILADKATAEKAIVTKVDYEPWVTGLSDHALLIVSFPEEAIFKGPIPVWEPPTRVPRLDFSEATDEEWEQFKMLIDNDPVVNKAIEDIKEATETEDVAELAVLVQGLQTLIMNGAATIFPQTKATKGKEKRGTTKTNRTNVYTALRNINRRVAKLHREAVVEGGTKRLINELGEEAKTATAHLKVLKARLTDGERQVSVEDVGSLRDIWKDLWATSADLTSSEEPEQDQWDTHFDSLAQIQEIAKSLAIAPTIAGIDELCTMAKVTTKGVKKHVHSSDQNFKGAQGKYKRQQDFTSNQRRFFQGLKKVEYMSSTHNGSDSSRQGSRNKEKSGV
jgi:exonuclease III